MAGYKFRILFDNALNQEIFRDIVIRKEASFEEFYKTILEAFELSNDQMASFYVSNEDWDKGQEISLMDVSFGNEESEEPPVIMEEVNLEDFVQDTNQRFILVHNFLSMMIFLIELRDITKAVTPEPMVSLAVGTIPDVLKNDSQEDIDDLMYDDIFDEEEDEFGFDDFDDEDFEEGYYEDFDDFDY